MHYCKVLPNVNVFRPFTSSNDVMSPFDAFFGVLIHSVHLSGANRQQKLMTPTNSRLKSLLFWPHRKGEALVGIESTMTITSLTQGERFYQLHHTIHPCRYFHMTPLALGCFFNAIYCVLQSEHVTQGSVRTTRAILKAAQIPLLQVPRTSADILL
jgi:hypothetical protein